MKIGRTLILQTIIVFTLSVLSYISYDFIASKLLHIDIEFEQKVQKESIFISLWSLFIAYKLLPRLAKSFFKLKLTYRVLIGFLLGIIVGITFRYNPDMLSFLDINATSFKTLGKIFIDLIKMIIGPMIFASITCSVMQIGDPSKASTLALKSMIVFVVMTFISIIIGITVTKLVKPGYNVIIDLSSMANGISDIEGIRDAKPNSVSDILIDIIPSNIFNAFYTSNFLQIIFFSVLFGFAILKSSHSSQRVSVAMQALNDIVFKVTDIVMNIAPIGIFGFVVWVFGTQNISLIKSLINVVLIVYGSVLGMVYILYPSYMVIFLRINPIFFIKKMAQCQFMGFLLASSSSVLPLSMNTAETKLGVSKGVSSFVIPFGATINMNGTAVNLGVSVIFISQVFGTELDMSQIGSLIILCTLGAMGTAPIPGASIFMLSGILSVFNLPIEGIGIILAIDRLLDMMRTFGNITGDVLSAVIVDKINGTFDEDTYKNAKN
jgi:Na+/H+-dicarboxylate symporter